ncbi:transketolase family protein [Verminephrobacter eiseniae]|uniref:Transketolase subunit B n=1 Tax=Verminephrobacter eiseniae (strain EF01-2) TaxID=391735 RepID=A1WGC3_VEREI|nr:transketolase C-terminal domain-containing protein [Verminephrobacter eiseniae]ABM56680.1 transketolase subunit B [Verminephrobacter eiseniae EF01-2]MCW5287038.1 transketolase family protein [Verminephrobacter eiseniae]MCW5305336.1 transketolase family protein [Verminephrobacter eiseniae]MCW8179173.1 transketolase family protein [Verminephrobacter eiseniae]MCW8189765.1 transketolase family protein [Verminephrobacter eiseniae]
MHNAQTLSHPPARTLAMGESEAVVGRPTVRAPFSLGLMKAAANHPELVLLTADLGKYTDVADFRARYGERFFNVGMAEQALVGAAAGLSKVGKVAYCTTYGTFATRRAYDFLAIACAHSHENVKMFAGNPGLTTGYGGTHQATEDLALMRSIPNMSVIDPCDATEMAQIAEMAADLPGTLYCRLLRADVAQVFDPATHRWRPGTGHVIGSSAADTDVGLVSTGLMTGRAIDAAGHLRQRGASASVFHSASLKPFDSQGLLAFAQSARRLVVLENHVASGGLATLVIEALQEAGLARRLLKIALPDQFIECGSLAYLQERYGLTTERICARVGAWLQ